MQASILIFFGVGGAPVHTGFRTVQTARGIGQPPSTRTSTAVGSPTDLPVCRQSVVEVIGGPAAASEAGTVP
jgi:hypothetical protein